MSLPKIGLQQNVSTPQIEQSLPVKYQEIVHDHLEQLNYQLGIQINDLREYIKKNRLSIQQNLEQLQKIDEKRNVEENRTKNYNNDDVIRQLSENNSVIRNIQDQLKQKQQELYEIQKYENETINAKNEAFRNPGPNFAAVQRSSTFPRVHNQDAQNSELKSEIKSVEEQIEEIKQDIQERQKTISEKNRIAAELSERLKSIAFSISSLTDSWQKLTKTLAIEADKTKSYSTSIKIHMQNKQVYDEQKRRHDDEHAEYLDQLSKVATMLDNRQKQIIAKQNDLEGLHAALRNADAEISNAESKLYELHDAVYRASVIYKLKKSIREHLETEISQLRHAEIIENELLMSSNNLAAVKQNILNLRRELQNLKTRKIFLYEDHPTENDDEDIKRLTSMIQTEKADTKALSQDINEYTQRLSILNNDMNIWANRLSPYLNVSRKDTDEKRNILIEIRHIKEEYGNTKKKIQKVKKDLEMCALRRDFVTLKAKTTVSRKNLTRSQVLTEIDKLKSRVATMKLNLAEINEKTKRFMMATVG